MKKKFFLKESDLRNLISNIIEQVDDENQYYKISAQEYKDKLDTVDYRGDILTRLKIFKGKPLWIVGDLSLYGKPVSTLGNVARIEGNLDIGNTDIADVSNIEITGRVNDFNSKREKLRKAAELRKRREEADVRRQSGVWDEENTDDEGKKANALFNWLVKETELEELSDEEKEELNSLVERLSELKQEYDIEGTAFEMGPLYNEIKEIEEKIIELESKGADVYDLIPYNWSHWGLQTFEVLGLNNREYTVGTQEEMDEAVLEFAKSFIDETGVEGFNRGFIESYIDRNYLEKYIYDFYYDDISQNPKIYFDDSDYELTDEQEKRKEELEEYISKMEDFKSDLQDKMDNSEHNSDEYNELEEKIQEIDENIETAQEKIDSLEPETEPTDEMIEDKVDDWVRERMRDPLEFITEFGLDLEDFIDKDDLAQAYVDADGYGIMNNYDGNYDTIYFDDTEYYIMRVN